MMSILNILHYPDKRLRLKANTVTIIDDNVLMLIRDMFDTMYHARGIGLAATQVNVHKKIIVVDISGDYSKKMVLINPVIISCDNLISIEEGCLSVPRYLVSTTRYKNIVVHAYNCIGKFFKLHVDDLLSICIQHEIDHLFGRLIIDYCKN